MYHLFTFPPLLHRSDYFGMPFHAAAQALNLHDTQLQRICRKVNIQKWPYQQVVTGKFEQDFYYILVYIYIYYKIVINFFQ